MAQWRPRCPVRAAGASYAVTVSFGASRPAVQGHDDSAWKFNRRVDTLVNK